MRSKNSRRLHSEDLGGSCRYSHSDPAGKLKGSVRDSTKSTPQTKHQQSQEQAWTVSWARPPASSYTAQEQAASTYAAHAEPAGPQVPTVCYTCFSHDHDTSQCTLHQHTTAMFAETHFDTEPPTTTEDAQSWFGVLVALLLTCAMTLTYCVRKLLSLDNIKSIAVLALVVLMCSATRATSLSVADRVCLPRAITSPTPLQQRMRSGVPWGSTANGSRTAGAIALQPTPSKASSLGP